MDVGSSSSSSSSSNGGGGHGSYGCSSTEVHGVFVTAVAQFQGVDIIASETNQFIQRLRYHLPTLALLLFFGWMEYNRIYTYTHT